MEADHEHDHGHSHGAQIVPANAKEAAFLSLIYRTFRENDELKTAYQTLLGQTVKALLRCLEERDPYTYGHSMRVMSYAMLIARGANLKESDLRNLEVSAMFHDIGKVGIPDCVLLKPGRLNADEAKVIMQHPTKSAEILGIIDAFKNAVPGARHHHERMDGEGYPDKLTGTQIPLASRIILVADTFDAMTSTRPYRKALPVEVAYAELERYSGSQFDPEFVKVFLQEHKKLTLRLTPEEAADVLKKAA
ncbi:MAG: HD-GYP domain-containing protein [Deltaproteobacteria bacterium]|nr:HD-GYP domain-containing protein [Deltaproteobacteria bacterium]